MEVRNVVMSIVSITVGILLVGSLLAPQAASVMEELTDLNQSGWASLVGVTVVLVIISLILIALLGFSSKKQRKRGEKA
jgi:heme/copper-type cytochrome/quinol oxidase subunit 2